MHTRFLFALTAFATLAFALPAAGSVNIDSSQAFTQIDAYSARADVQGSATGEAGELAVEYGPTDSYGKKVVLDTVDADTFLRIQATVTGLKPSTLYHYRYKITGKTTGAVATSADRMFTTTAAVPVDAPTAPLVQRLVEAGYSTTLNAQGETGSRPFTYQWRKNGANVGPAGPQSYYHLNRIELSDGGKWSVKVSNADSSDISPEALMTVAKGTELTSKVIPEGGSFTLSVALNPPDPSAIYFWHEDGTGTLPAGIGAVTGQWTNKLIVKDVTASAAIAYACDVTVGGQTITLYGGQANIGLKPVIDPVGFVFTAVGASLYAPVNVSNAPTQVKVTGLPPGVVYNPGISGVVGAPLVEPPAGQIVTATITAKNQYGKAVPQTIQFNIDPIDPGAIGTFYGTLTRESDETHLGGAITLTVTPAGLVTGTLLTGKLRYPLRGSVQGSRGSTSVAFNVASLKSGKNPELQLNVTMDQKVLSGTVSGPGGMATVNGGLSTWSAKNPTSLAGVYHSAFKPQSPESTDVAFPHGASLGIFTVAPDGGVKFTLRMGDGSVRTGKTRMTDIGRIEIFTLFYGGHGSVVGGVKATMIDIVGSVSWNRESGVAGRAYGAGFATHSLTAAGGHYVAPDPGAGERFLGLAATTSNAKIAFSDATLTTPVDYTFTIDADNKAVIAKDTGTNPNAVTMKLNPKTGEVSGTFSVTDPNPLGGGDVTRVGTYSGLATPGMPGQVVGYFLIPDLPAMGPPDTNTNIKKNPMRSGILKLSAP